MPRLLRTESYQREVLRATKLLPEAEIEQRVALNVARQAVVDRKEACTFRFYLNEHVVNHRGIDQETASDQLRHLLRIAVRPNVDIRIVPESTGLPCATHSFELFKFPTNAPPSTSTTSPAQRSSNTKQRSPHTAAH